MNDPVAEPEPTTVEVVLRPGPGLRAYVDGERRVQVPMLVIAAPGVDLMVSPPGSAITSVDTAGAELIAAAAAEYRDRLRELARQQEETA